MADTPIIKTKRITREKLATVFKNHELIKAFENLQDDVVSALPEAIAESSTDADSVLGTGAFMRQPHHVPDILDDAQRVMTAAVFIPRAPHTPSFDDEAGRILATQIFGA